MDSLLQVDQLSTHFRTPRGLVKAVDGVDLRLRKGEILGIVGESGSGKSVMAQSLLRVVPKSNLARSDGRVLFDGTDLMHLNEEGMRRVRGARIAMVTQNPSTSLNPVLTVGAQLMETMRFHPDRSPDPSRLQERMLAMMHEVQLPNPAAIAQRYPFQLSGGMKQRISIAMALLCEPEILIADEPTTALDVTIQAQILDLIRSLRQAHGTSVIFITHDLGVVAQLCDSVAVMYGGKVIEYNTASEIFRRPRHPYTQGLLQSNPVFGNTRSRLHAMPGQPPDLAALGPGCAFAPRCSKAQHSCLTTSPSATIIDGHFRHLCPVAETQEAASA